MGNLKKSLAFVSAAVLAFSSLTVSGYTNYQHISAEDIVSQHIDYYNQLKDYAPGLSSVHSLLSVARNDKDDHYVMLETIMKNAGISQSQQETVIGNGWSEDLAAEVLFSEIMLSSDFINALGDVYRSEYDRLINTIVASLRKNDSSADRNSIYRITQTSFEKYFSNYISDSQMKDLKSAYKDTKSFYDACVAYTAYKWTRDSLITMLKSCANSFPYDHNDGKFALFISGLAKMNSGVAVSSFSKASQLISIADGAADTEKSSEYAEVILTELLDGKCMMLGVLMPKFDVQFHRDINFFDEVMKKYNCDVDSKAEERNLYLGSNDIYYLIGFGIRSENGFSNELLNQKTEKSVEPFELGVMFYKKSTEVMCDHALKYSTTGSVKDNNPEYFALALNAASLKNKLSSFACHGTVDRYFTPYAGTVINGNADIEYQYRNVKVSDGVLLPYDEYDSDEFIYADLIKLSEDDSRQKFVMAQSNGMAKVEITARENGNIEVVMSKYLEGYCTLTIDAVKGRKYLIDYQTLTITDTETGAVLSGAMKKFPSESGDVVVGPSTGEVSPSVPTTKVTTVTTPAPTTKVTTVTTPAPTTKVTTVTTPAPTAKVTTVTTPVPTTKVTTVTTPVQTTKVTKVTTPAPTTNVTKVTTPAPVTTRLPETTAPVMSDLKGDITNDGSVNSADLAVLCRHILDQTFGIHGNTDINGDGQTDAADLAELMNIILSR